MSQLIVTSRYLKTEIRKIKQNAETIQSILLPVKLSRYEVKIC